MKAEICTKVMPLHIQAMSTTQGLDLLLAPIICFACVRPPRQRFQWDLDQGLNGNTESKKNISS